MPEVEIAGVTGAVEDFGGDEGTVGDEGRGEGGGEKGARGRGAVCVDGSIGGIGGDDEGSGRIAEAGEEDRREVGGCGQSTGVSAS